MARSGDRHGPLVTILAEDVARRLEELPDEALTKLGRRGLKEAARPMVDAAKANLLSNGSVDLGALREAVDVKSARGTRAPTVYAIVGPARGAKFNLVDAVTGKRVRVPVKYAHLVEFGTAPHKQKGYIPPGTAPHEQEGYLHPGAAPRPFMRPAFDSTSSQLRKGIEDAIKKAVDA